MPRGQPKKKRQKKPINETPKDENQADVIMTDLEKENAELKARLESLESEATEETQEQNDTIEDDDNRYVLFFVPERGTLWTRKNQVTVRPPKSQEKNIYVYPEKHRLEGKMKIPNRFIKILSGGDGVIVDQRTIDWYTYSSDPCVIGDKSEMEEGKKQLIYEQIPKGSKLLNKNIGDVQRGYLLMPRGWDTPGKQKKNILLGSDGKSSTFERVDMSLS